MMDRSSEREARFFCGQKLASPYRSADTSSFQEEVGSFGGAFLLGIIAAIVIWIGWLQGFFKAHFDETWNRGIRLLHVLVAFGLYFIVSWLAAPLYINLLQPFSHSQIGYASWVNFLLSSSILGALLLWWKFFPSDVRSGVWRGKDASSSYAQDFKSGFYGWCIAFPVVLFVNQLFGILIYLVTGLVEIPDQIAVRFVKMTAAYPGYFLLAIASIVVIAPIVEEFLFRALLQSFIRKHLGSKQAILITAICFACFHFSFEQGIGNISIIASLMPLALMLGFVYEKQRSLFSSISLHVLFNAMSILNLYFIGDILK